MTRKHFEAIAEILASHKQESPMGNEELSVEHMRKQLIEQVAEFFQTQNERFNYVRFVEACNK